MANIIQNRFNELSVAADSISSSSSNTGSFYSVPQIDVDSDLLLKWLTKTEDLISNVCGKESTYYKNFVEAKNSSSYNGNKQVFDRVKSVFIATKDDYEKGYLDSYKSLIQAEVFDSELDQAKSLLSSGYYTAAAVIAGTVLETSLRELCERKSLSIGKLDKMNADLAKQGLYNSIQQKHITTLAGIRNSAAHGKADEFTQNDVSNMINSIETFLITHLN